MTEHIYCRHSTELEVPFFDVDALHIVWHGHYVKYLEVARCAFLSAIGYDYSEMGRQGYSWPVVQLNLKYIKPARFGSRIRIDLAVTEIESCLRIRYTITDCDSGTKLTKGSTVQAAVSLADGRMQFQTPPGWLEAVRRHPTFQAV
ncbi:thioesterase family protein [Neisseria leonii]|uniref:Acyl-CoA thioesterase n=1 Tax=Neisseria leonii TaxID=2995413 RepID=A0A9X4IEI1_9NEIS|nr:thioesterase family protein [Neisseria sp. 51.81]MDD9328212.1 acyl-CoA thioesterase [Neisseria sp. 51.81]